jgi:electron transfer flavoprotein alpha/beta subunit
MAMGADNGLLLCDDDFETIDGKQTATLLKAAVEKGNYDLILTGAQADGEAQVKRVDYFVPEMGEGTEMLDFLPELSEAIEDL